MSIRSQITRLENAKADIIAAITEKGVSIPSTVLLEDIADYIRQIVGGISGYTNLVPTSIDTDGSVYKGVGYIDGYRLSSSGGISAQTNTVTTGFIPCKSTDLIRMSGASWFPPSGNLYLAFYDASFAVLGSINCYVNSSFTSGYASTARGIVKHKGITSGTTDNHPTQSNGVITFDQYEFTDGSAVAYFRVNGIGSGADMIVTVNEEIIL